MSQGLSRAWELFGDLQGSELVRSGHLGVWSHKLNHYCQLHANACSTSLHELTGSFPNCTEWGMLVARLSQGGQYLDPARSLHHNTGLLLRDLVMKIHTSTPLTAPTTESLLPGSISLVIKMERIILIVHHTGMQKSFCELGRKSCINIKL